MKKILCVFFGIIMVFSGNSFANAEFIAPELSKAEWDTLYESLSGENNLPTLNVGSDETQLSLCWHADADKAVAEVRVADNEVMENYKVFKGETTPAENSEQLVCRVTLTGFEENSTYYYQWHTGKGWSKAYKYETKSFTDHKILVVGDIQINEGYDGDYTAQSDVGYYWNNFLAEALKNNPDISFLVTPGDNTSTGGTCEEWQTLLIPEAIRSLPMAMAIGNHDKKGMTYNYYTNMPNEYFGRFFAGLDRDFWFRYGDVLYLFFDSTSGNAPDHMAFAKEAVKLNQDAKWRIGVVHHGIYGAGDSIGDAETEILLKTIFAPIFEIYDLDLVITGHTHSQGRSHFMEKGKIKTQAPSGGTFTNPEGIVYLNSNAVYDFSSFEFDAEHLAYKFIENDTTTYSTIDFKGDKLILETRRGDNSELLDSIVIEKTVNEHNDNTFSKFIDRMLYKVVEFAGFVYTMIDNLVRRFK